MLSSGMLAVSSRMAGVMWCSNALVRCIRAVLPENAVAAITLAIILASNEHCARGPRVMMMECTRSSYSCTFGIHGRHVQLPVEIYVQICSAHA